MINYIWLAGIGTTLMLAAVWWRRGRDCIARQPGLRRGYRRLVLGLILWGNIPWVVMGFGLLASPDKLTVWRYVTPAEGNPWVLTWYAIVLVLWALCLGWLIVGSGAEALVRHPGLFAVPLGRPEHVKLVACAVAVGCVLGMAMVVGRDALGQGGTSGHDEYTTVFVVYSGFRRTVMFAALFMGIGVVGLAVAILGVRHVVRMPRWWASSKAGLAAWCLLLWSVVWLGTVLVAGPHVLSRSYRLLSAYRDGRALVTEGTVHVLQEQDWGGARKGGLIDLVDIGGVRLEVDYYTIDPMYRRTIARGGALREGTSARVWYHNRKILRVDVRE